MITSALIAECRSLYDDRVKSSQAARVADGSSVLFNLGRFPIIENSYAVYFSGAIKTEPADFSLDKDNGDLQTFATQAAGITIRANFKYANFRDNDWVKAVNYGIDELNARGFFKQISRNTSVFSISAGVRAYDAPSAAVDVYEILRFSNRTTSGTYQVIDWGWDYQQDSNKILFDATPTYTEPTATSYLRSIQKYSATSATLDIPQAWVGLVKKKAGEYYFRHMASKIATHGAATIDEGHFSFTNARAMASDLALTFENEARRAKPTRPAKVIQFKTAFSI